MNDHGWSSSSPSGSILDDTSVLEGLRNGARLNAGERHKGTTLDLQGLSGVLVAEVGSPQFLAAVLRLLRAVRSAGKVRVLVYPGDEVGAWFLSAEIPGYLAPEIVSRAEGYVLNFSPRKPRRKKERPPLPGADQVITQVRRGKEFGCWRVCVVGPARQRRWMHIKTSRDDTNVGRLQALNKASQRLPGPRVAIPAWEPLTRLLGASATPSPKPAGRRQGPRLVALYDVVEELRRARRWTITADGRWLVGFSREEFTSNDGRLK